LHGVFVNGKWCEYKEVIKDKVRVFFEDRFAMNDDCQVRLDNVKFSSISESDNELLIGDFLKMRLGLQFGVVTVQRALTLMVSISVF